MAENTIPQSTCDWSALGHGFDHKSLAEARECSATYFALRGAGYTDSEAFDVIEALRTGKPVAKPVVAA